LTFGVSGLTSIGFGANANAAAISLTNNVFANGGNVGFGGNYTVNNQLTLSNNTVSGGTITFSGLNNVVGSAVLTNNVAQTVSFGALQCVSSVSVTGNSGAFTFPVLKFAGSGGIINGGNSNGFTITVQGTSGGTTACYDCNSTTGSGSGSTCGGGVVAAFSVACARVNGQCPFAVTVPTTSSSSSAATSTTATTSSVTTSSVSRSTTSASPATTTVNAAATTTVNAAATTTVNGGAATTTVTRTSGAHALVASVVLVAAAMMV